MKHLFDRVIDFRNQNFEEMRELFEELGQGQKPHTLFIGCSDSRVVPSLITRTLPGELFVVRNIANMVPPWRQTSDYASTTAVIEYAVNVLNVEHIVVCGHSHCGGMAAMMGPDEALDSLPNVRNWLRLAQPVREEVESRGVYRDARDSWQCELLNVCQQVRNLMTYPEIARKVEAGTLEIHGWYYVIESGEVFHFDQEQDRFCLVEESTETPTELPFGQPGAER